MKLNNILTKQDILSLLKNNQEFAGRVADYLMSENVGVAFSAASDGSQPAEEPTPQEIEVKSLLNLREEIKRRFDMDSRIAAIRFVRSRVNETPFSNELSLSTKRELLTLGGAKNLVFLTLFKPHDHS